MRILDVGTFAAYPCSARPWLILGIFVALSTLFAAASALNLKLSRMRGEELSSDVPLSRLAVIGLLIAAGCMALLVVPFMLTRTRTVLAFDDRYLIETGCHGFTAYHDQRLREDLTLEYRVGSGRGDRLGGMTITSRDRRTLKVNFEHTPFAGNITVFAPHVAAAFADRLESEGMTVPAPLAAARAAEARDH